MRYEGNKVVITESELHDLVNESVKLYLKENLEDEWFGQNLYNGMKNVVGAGVDKIKQAGNTVGAAYYNGAANGQIQKLQNMINQHEAEVKKLQDQIAQLQGKAQGYQNAAAQNQANYQNRFNNQSTQQSATAAQPQVAPKRVNIKTGKAAAKVGKKK